MSDAFFDYITQNEVIISMSTITFLSPNSFSIRENLKTIGAITATIDSDLPISYSISGGTDAEKFAVQGITGAAVLSFVNEPDFESPTDANADNVYAVEITATDGQGTTATQLISVTVTDIDDVLEKTEDLAEAVATDVASLIAATTALETNKADKAALELAQQSLNSLQSDFAALNAKVDLPAGGTVSAAIETAVSGLENKLLNGVAVEFDTFKEVADEFARNADLIAALQNIGAGAIRFDIAQVTTAAQKKRAQMNMGAADDVEFQDFKAAMGNPATHDPVAKYHAKKAELGA